MWNDLTAQPGFRRWFEWNVRNTIRLVRLDLKNEPWLRQALTDQEVVECVVSYIAERAERFITPADWAWLSDLEMDGDCHIEYNRDAVLRGIARATEKAQEALEVQREALAGIREGNRFADQLDSWLRALHTGQLKWSGPTEERGESFVVDYKAFLERARKRRVRWPRVCRTCGDEFRIEKGNAKNCDDCRARRRAARA